MNEAMAQLQKCRKNSAGADRRIRRPARQENLSLGAVKMYEFDEGVERSKYFYEPKALDAVTGVYVTNAVKKRRLEETQLELYQLDE